VQRAMVQAGFTDVALTPVVLRKEAGKQVHGLIVQGRRA